MESSRQGQSLDVNCGIEERIRYFPLWLFQGLALRHEFGALRTRLIGRDVLMALKPWYKVVTPREDLRDGRPLDASEFAVHLDHVRDHRAPADYKKPERFFDRTFLTSSLCELGGGVVRRLSGIKVEPSAVYNVTTQFGGA